MPEAVANAEPGAAERPPLRLHPFRGVLYAPDRVSDLAAVTSPPYDVIDADAVTHLESLDPHNVVRLILPRDRVVAGQPGSTTADRSRTGDASTAGAGSRYDDAAARLAEWLGDGTLTRDDQAALYVYEQTAPGLAQRGILGAVELRDPADRVVLPHEDVMPGPVADRLELMRTTGANLEPILLVYEGGGDTAAVIDEVAATPPMLDTRSEDGLRQRMWRLTDAALLDRVATDLAPRQALIADGHHRYATYRRLQAERRASGADQGPWDRGLALLVDSVTHPLRVQAIHRVLEGLPLAEAAAALRPVFDSVRELPVGSAATDPAPDRAPDSALDQTRDQTHDTALDQTPGAALDEALGALADAPGRHPFLLSDGTSFVLVSDPDPTALAAALPPLQSDLWRSLDASVLHSLVLESVLDLDPTDERVRYVHDSTGAVRHAARSGGTAVLLRPVTVGQVLAVAALGERMPRKSTSFGPKPRTGLVLRLLDDVPTTP